MKHKFITIPVWDRHLLLMVGKDCKRIVKIAKKKGFSKKAIRDIKKDKLRSKDRGAAYWDKKKGCGMFWSPKKKMDKDTLLHEVVHLIDFLFRYIGAEKEMEARAYTAEWLFNNLSKKMKRL